jgi:phosphoribosylanthranilate isomerase
VTIGTLPSSPHLAVKICGVTTVGDAEACVAAGADFLGCNFVASSPRWIDVGVARLISRAVRHRAQVVGVVADENEQELFRLLVEAELDWVQLHGDEPSDLVSALSPHAYKAVRVGGPEDLATAQRYGGLLLLVDAKVTGKLGGTGRTVDPALVEPLARSRDVILAGGLTPENVGELVRAVRPWGVDVASGVEVAPGVKDLRRVAAFVRNAREAFTGLA